VADGQHAFVAGVFDQHVLKVRESCVGARAELTSTLASLAELGADKIGQLQGRLEGLETMTSTWHLGGRSTCAPINMPLVFAFFDEPPCVESGVLAEHSGTGVAHQVEDHGEQSGGDSCGFEWLPEKQF